MTLARPTLEWTTRVIEQRGLLLPWVRKEPYGRPAAPRTCPIHGRRREVPPENPRCTCKGIRKGAVLESGEVFVSSSDLYEVAERTIDDYLFHTPPPNIGYHEQLALEQAGLAERETRGGCHGTDKLRRFLGLEE